MHAQIPDDVTLQRLALRVANHLLDGKRKLATAESCTGGWIAKVLTDIAGSSDWFESGVVSYSNAAKQEILGVQISTLVEHGAVVGVFLYQRNHQAGVCTNDPVSQLRGQPHQLIDLIQRLGVRSFLRQRGAEAVGTELQVVE